MRWRPCVQQAVSGRWCCIPTLNNPTGHVAGAGRRCEIAAIAARHGVFVIEDEVYRPMIEEPLPSITEMLPDLGFFVTSFTKVVLTGVARWLSCCSTSLFHPRRLNSCARRAGVAPYLTGEIATRWVENGTAQRLLEIQRDEAQVRQNIATKSSATISPPLISLSLCAGSRSRRIGPRKVWFVRSPTSKVAVTPSEPFIAGPGHGGGIRICLGGRLNHAEAWPSALTTVRQAFEQLPPVFTLSVRSARATPRQSVESLQYNN